VRVIIIPADPGEKLFEEQAPDNAHKFGTWLNKKLGGTYEVHRPATFRRSGLVMWFAEDAKMHQQTPNARATALSTVAPNDYIAGNVVLTGSHGSTVLETPSSLDMIEVVVNAMMKYKTLPRR
jgi:hypothetical protein